MTIMVACEFYDGSEEIIRKDFATVNEAVLFALDQANKMGNNSGDGHGPPERLHVYNKDVIELTIKVFSGGLAPRRGH